MEKHRIPTVLFWIIASLVLSAVTWLWVMDYRESIRALARENRAVCVRNVRNAQMAVRLHQDRESSKTGSRVTIDQLMKAELLFEIPHCPDGNRYVCDEVVPAIGQLYLRCPDPHHNEFDHADW